MNHLRKAMLAGGGAIAIFKAPAWFCRPNKKGTIPANCPQLVARFASRAYSPPDLS